MPAGRPHLTLTQRLEYRAARALAALPARLQVRLSGRPPVVIEGETLSADTQLTLSLLERRGQVAITDQSPQQARLERRRLAAVYAGPPAEVAAVNDLDLDTEVPLRARHYAPAEPGGPHPLLVYYHGGGWVYGDLDTHDGLCRLLCRHAGVHVLAVDYRLAPENPFPAAVEDALAAFGWATGRAGALGADPQRVGVGGDSAGGNLSAVVAQLAREGGAPPALQLLVYPVTDLVTRRRSRELFGEGFLLTNEEMDWFEASYLGEDLGQARDPRVSPLLAVDLGGLAPAIVVTAGFDPLRDEGEAYAAALRAAGVPVTLRRFPGFIHAFAAAFGVSRAAREAVVEIAGMLRATFAGAALGAPSPGAGSEAASGAR